jgi:hypothetical protein
MKYRFVLIFILLPLFHSVAQVPKDSVFEAAVQRGISHVYNLEFEAADQDFATLVRLRPGHPAGHFFRAMVLWWKISTTSASIGRWTTLWRSATRCSI